MNEFLLSNINHYGVNAEIKKLSEEIFELQEAVLDYEHEVGDREHIIEEIADSHIILKQIQLFYNITESELSEMMERKMARQKARLDKELDN